MRLRFAFTFVRLLFVAGCAASSAEDAPATDESDITSTSKVLASAFYVKPTPMDQSGLGVVIADGIAFAPGARSQALPKITGFDHQELPDLKKARVELDGSSFDAIVGDSGRRAPPLFDASALRVGMKCKVLGTEMDMYASGPPKTQTLDVSIERVERFVLTKSTRSTGGDGTLLVCDGKLAGIQAGAGSQGTHHEFRVVDAKLVEAFERAKRDAR
jgi:hypothetical protein